LQPRPFSIAVRYGFEAAPWLARCREHKAYLEIDGNLLDVLRGEIGTVVCVENLWSIHLSTHAAELRARGSKVETVFPDSASQDALCGGLNMMDLSRRVPTAQAGSLLANVGDVGQPGSLLLADHASAPGLFHHLADSREPDVYSRGGERLRSKLCAGVRPRAALPCGRYSRQTSVVFRIIWRIISELFGVVSNAPLQHESDSPPDQDDFNIRHLPRRLSISRSSQEAALLYGYAK
jgi:hypothetical protein